MLLKKVQKLMKEHHMISANDRVIVGLSGGADSVCLLLMLWELRKELNFSLEAIHVEHGIRGIESKQDAAFAEKLCKERNIYFQMVSIDVPNYATEHGLGLEEAARILRYEIFEQIAKERNAKIALAHHMEDNAETILFQMARGSSLTGLCGIQPVRKSEAGVSYIRPLLCLHREEVEHYLDMQGQCYCVDCTNQDLEYSRNYLRKVIIPELKNINRQVVAHIHETAAHLGEIRDFLDEQTLVQWSQIATVGKDIVLDLSKLKQLHVVLQKEIIYKAIGIMAGGKKDISSIHVEQVLELFENQSGRETTLPNGVIAIRENETIRLFLSEKKSDKANAEAGMIQVTEEVLQRLLQQRETLSIPLLDGKQVMEISVFEKDILVDEIPRKTYTKWLDYDKIDKGFCIRTRQSGDYLICDVSGHRKKLKQYFVEEKIPVTKRDEIRILTQENLVLWVVGGRMSEHVKVTDETKVIMEITVKEEA